MKFKDKIVVVTGSTRGIGKSIAEHFAKEGAVVNIIGRSEETAQDVSGALNKAGLSADGYGCDVTDLDSVQKTINKILDKYKRLDILINNAGITKDNLILRMSVDDWDEVIRVNLRGVFNCTKVATKVMLKARKGKIINITSVIGITGNVGQANYAASKAGIIGFTKSVAREVASRGITVNGVAPGYVETEMTAELKESMRDEILKRIPLNRFGSSSDVANVCLFLASEEADYITGQTIVVDGGMAI